MPNYAEIGLLSKATPVFALIMIIEMIGSWRSSNKAYRFGDTIANLSTSLIFGLASLIAAAGYGVAHTWLGTVSGAFDAPLLTDAYPLSFENGLSINPSGLVSFFIVLVFVDFLYYWFHRAAHEINFLWACHVTHHSSEEFNYSVALRQCAFQRFFEYAFMLPLALLGVSFYYMLFCHAILKIYQFWVHSRYIPKLGWFEYVFLTPSQHRIHHASDTKYLDKNHGGIFIVWDRWFGTFAEEEEEPVYGLTKNINTYNPVWANVHHYVKIWQDFKSTPTLLGKLKVLFYGPGWKYTPDNSIGRLGGVKGELQATAPGAPAASFTTEHSFGFTAHTPDYNPKPVPGLSVYTIVHFVLMVLLTLAVLRGVRSGNLPAAEAWLLAAIVVITLIVLNALNQAKPWALKAEVLRPVLLTMPGLVFQHPAVLAAGIALAAASWAWLFFSRPLRRRQEEGSLHPAA